MQTQTKTPQSGKTAALCNNQKTEPENTPAHAGVNTTFGPPELCTWRADNSTYWFQTNQPSIARKLSQRSGARLVAWAVNGGYLRVFQEKISPRSARKLVSRYLNGFRNLERGRITPTNARFLGLERPPSRRNLCGRVKTAAIKERAS